jgi:hypothetical protein
MPTVNISDEDDGMNAWLRLVEHYPVLLLFLIPIAIGVYWHRISLGVLRLSQQRTQRLYRLMTTDGWKKAQPLALQLAVADAFKRQFDDRAIRLAFTRHRPLQLLSDYRRADGIAVVSADGARFEDGSRWQVATRPAAFGVLIALAMIPWLIATIGAQFQWLNPVQVVLFALFGVIWTPLLMQIAFAIEAARRLIFTLDKRYPPLQNVGVTEEGSTPAAPEKTLGSRKRKQPVASG